MIERDKTMTSFEVEVRQVCPRNILQIIKTPVSADRARGGDSTRGLSCQYGFVRGRGRIAR